MTRYPKKEKERHETDIYNTVRASSSRKAKSFIRKHCLQYQMDNLLWDPKRGMIVFKYKDTIQGKAVDPMQVPKCFTYSWNGTPYIAKYRDGGTRELLIVEDPCSAARASELIDSMALLGTTWYDSYNEELKPYDVVLVALDYTASDKAVKLMSYLTVFKDVEVLFIDTDIKDMSTNQLSKLLCSTEAFNQEAPWA